MLSTPAVKYFAETLSIRHQIRDKALFMNGKYPFKSLNKQAMHLQDIQAVAQQNASAH
jgi:hypothetical protein